MSPGGARRGRRDNGLDAAEYAVAGDVDPRVGEHLLDVLAAGGIAAYLQPAADLNPVTRTTTIPPTPTDRLYVDREHLETARDYLRQLAADERRAADEEQQRAGAGNEPEVEAEWARIVAAFHTEVEPGATPWPEAEALAAQPEPPAPRRLVDGRATTEPSLLDGLDTFGADLPDDDDEEEGYTPPPPPPLPRVSRYAVAGVLAIVVGVIMFIAPGLVPIGEDMSMVIGFLMIIAGFVTLIWRLRSGDDEDYDPDDGARV